MPTHKKELIILDTHVWIWLLEETGDLSKIITNKINNAAKDKQVLIAAISLWEVSLLAAKKRIIFKEDVYSWLNKALHHPGIMLCQLTSEIAAQSYKLPAVFHGDPADRMIVATARIHHATLLTRDKNILQYAKTGHLNTLPA
jgi:PIN domain nuclease of toxin-antitoxin system